MVCKQLGFSKAAEFTVSSKFGNVSADFSFDQVECSGQEITLEDCKHDNTEDCGPDEGAGVVCLQETPLGNIYVFIVGIASIFHAYALLCTTYYIFLSHPSMMRALLLLAKPVDSL